jgi:hypothetical protein
LAKAFNATLVAMKAHLAEISALALRPMRLARGEPASPGTFGATQPAVHHSRQVYRAMPSQIIAVFESARPGRADLKATCACLQFFEQRLGLPQVEHVRSLR